MFFDFTPQNVKNMLNISLSTLTIFRMGEEVFLSLENLPLNYSMAMDEENEIMIRRLTLFFVPIAFAVILVIGLIGNILVIIVVSRHFACTVRFSVQFTVKHYNYYSCYGSHLWLYWHRVEFTIECVLENNCTFVQNILKQTWRFLSQIWNVLSRPGSQSKLPVPVQ